MIGTPDSPRSRSQSRPITSLYPLPAPPPPGDGLHVYFSFNHVQVMPAAMPPLARSVLRTLIPFGKRRRTAESTLVASAGGRLFIDVTYVMRLPGPRRLLPKVLSNADELMASALAEVAGREEFLRGRRPGLTFLSRVLGWIAPALLRGLGYESNDASVVTNVRFPGWSWILSPSSSAVRTSSLPSTAEK